MHFCHKKSIAFIRNLPFAQPSPFFDSRCPLLYRSSRKPVAARCYLLVNAVGCADQKKERSCKVRYPRVVIEYCIGCRWGLRAAWMAQELLVTFEADLGEVALRPGTTGGVFDVWVNDRLVWSRREIKRFPELKEMKQLVRDVIVPEKSLGHSDEMM
eukprot:GFKZ01010967.1.p1 GENE.GFKZ01010967.1~~GFKZ01010967.1.p1  ORF type:complete len:157 (-),score=3.61 GFKZ01010967.1:499-969(-)